MTVNLNAYEKDRFDKKLNAKLLSLKNGEKNVDVLDKQ